MSLSYTLLKVICQNNVIKSQNVCRMYLGGYTCDTNYIIKLCLNSSMFHPAPFAFCFNYMLN